MLTDFQCFEAKDEHLEPWMRQVCWLYESGEDDRAADLLRALAVVSPRATSVWEALALHHQRRGEEEIASALLLAAISLSGGDEGEGS